jgi:hypothetical protein
LLVVDLFWEKSTAGWCLISQANRLSTLRIPEVWSLSACYTDNHITMPLLRVH